MKKRNKKLLSTQYWNIGHFVEANRACKVHFIMQRPRVAFPQYSVNDLYLMPAVNLISWVAIKREKTWTIIFKSHVLNLVNINVKLSLICTSSYSLDQVLGTCWRLLVRYFKFAIKARIYVRIYFSLNVFFMQLDDKWTIYILYNLLTLYLGLVFQRCPSIWCVPVDCWLGWRWGETLSIPVWP